MTCHCGLYGNNHIFVLILLHPLLPGWFQCQRASPPFLDDYNVSFFFQFPDGILFPDTIEVNFSVTVDPNSRRKPEDNDNLKSVIKVTNVNQAADKT